MMYRATNRQQKAFMASVVSKYIKGVIMKRNTETKTVATSTKTRIERSVLADVRVQESGWISFYFAGHRYPVNVTPQQFLSIIDNAENIKKSIASKVQDAVKTLELKRLARSQRHDARQTNTRLAVDTDF